MDVELFHKPERNNLVPDALSCREKLISPSLLMFVDDDLNDVKNDTLKDVRKAITHDEDAVTNNRFFLRARLGKKSSGRSAYEELTKEEWPS